MSHNHIMCPVMNSAVDIDRAIADGLTAEHNGNVFFFCCAGCKPKFESNPVQFTAGLPPRDAPSARHGCC